MTATSLTPNAFRSSVTSSAAGHRVAAFEPREVGAHLNRHRKHLRSPARTHLNHRWLLRRLVAGQGTPASVTVRQGCIGADTDPCTTR